MADKDYTDCLPPDLCQNRSGRFYSLSFLYLFWSRTARLRRHAWRLPQLSIVVKPGKSNLRTEPKIISCNSPGRWMIFSSFVGIVIVRCVQETFCMQCDSARFYPLERYLKYCRGAVDRILLLTSRMPLGNARFSIRLADSIATCKQFRQNCSVFRIVVIKGRRFI